MQEIENKRFVVLPLNLLDPVQEKVKWAIIDVEKDITVHLREINNTAVGVVKFSQEIEKIIAIYLKIEDKL